MNNYTVDYFIKKFEAIPENLWCTNSRIENGKRCALGWCYKTGEEAFNSMHNWSDDSDEDKALCLYVRTLDGSWGVGGVNNGLYKEYQQPTPKQRILAALYDIKKMEDEKFNKEVKELQEKKGNIRYVAVSESLRDIAKETVLETIVNN